MLAVVKAECAEALLTLLARGWCLVPIGVLRIVNTNAQMSGVLDEEMQMQIANISIGVQMLYDCA